MDETTAIAPGVEKYECTSFYELIGTKDALLAAGLAKEEWFWNGRRSVNGRRLTTVRFKIDGNRAICRLKFGTDDVYEINVTYPEEERKKRRQEQEQAAQRQIEQEVAEWRRQRAREALATPGGVRKSAEGLLDSAEAYTVAAFNATGSPDRPWSFPAETVEKVKWHFREILQLFKDGGFEVRPGSILQSDVDFQRFIQRATSAPGG